MIFCGNTQRFILGMLVILGSSFCQASKRQKYYDIKMARMEGKQVVHLTSEIISLLGQGKIFEQSVYLCSCILKLEETNPKLYRDCGNAKQPLRAYLEGVLESLETLDIKKLIQDARFSSDQSAFVKEFHALCRSCIGKMLKQGNIMPNDFRRFPVLKACAKRYENSPGIQCWLKLLIPERRSFVS